MKMNKETYERSELEITAFDVEDIITTSGVGPGGGGGTEPATEQPTSEPLGPYELPVGGLPVGF